MGKNQSEKLKSYDYKNRIIDYAFSNKKSDFLDIFLLSNCDFYFGGLRSKIYCPDVFKTMLWN